MRLRSRMILSILLTVAIPAAVLMVVGGWLLWYRLGEEAENRVRLDLNAAREFYEHRREMMEGSLRYTVLGRHFARAIAVGDLEYVAPRLAALRDSAGLDLLYATDASGRVIYRAHKPGSAGDSLAGEPLVSRILEGRRVVSGTVLIPAETLAAEDPSVAARAGIRLLDTPKAKPSDRKELDAGMVLCAATAVCGSDGKPVGVLWAGTLLNRNYDLVDDVQNTVFRDQRYRGKLLGTATIFQDDVRVSTNVRRDDGSRAIGTRVSAEVYDHVLGKEETWVGPAWVVNDWYISAYEPICDVKGRAIGMLYVGVLQRKYHDLLLRTYTIFALVACAGLLAAGVVSWQLSGRIARPVSDLASASTAIAEGDLSQELLVESADEIGSLVRTFNTMARALRTRDELLKEQTRLQLTRSERLASIGRLAAGVAHEINNPLTGVLTFAHMRLKEAPEGSPEREDIETIIDATTRCKEIVRGLLGFSRQSEPEKKLTDLNGVLGEAQALIQNQAGINQVNIEREIAPESIEIVIDPNQIQEVAVNLMLNAIDAMPGGGTLTLRSRVVEEEDAEWAEFEVKDTGCGIEAKALDEIFDPFFTTKPAGEGTGLGLAIAYGIITEHGGRISVSSEVGRGTTVTVRLPITSEEEQDEAETTDNRDR